MTHPLTNCVHCEARMSSKTAKSYGGLCKRCGLKAKRVRSHSLLFVGMVAIIAGLWWWTNVEMRNAEQIGGSFVTLQILAAAYEKSGSFGVNVIFLAAFLLTLLIAASHIIAGYRQTQAIRRSLDQTSASRDMHE